MSHNAQQKNNEPYFDNVLGRDRFITREGLVFILPEKNEDEDAFLNALNDSQKLDLIDACLQEIENDRQDSEHLSGIQEITRRHSF